MTYLHLPEFIEALENRKLLHRVKSEVDPVLEMAEITDRVTKAGGKALLFERAKGSEIPVAINLFGSQERIEIALGVSDYKEISDRIAEFLQPPSPSGLIEKMQLLPKLMEMNKFLPRSVKSGACQEAVVKNPSLAELPILQCWPKDGGRYITFPLVITKDLETGKRNVGCYRMQVYDETTTGMHWQIHKDAAKQFKKYKEAGKRMEVAVALGADPATLFSAVCPLPPDLDEILFSGFLRRKPVDMVKCAGIDIEVPAESEIILEGYVEPDETRVEGPFGDHTGFYSLQEPYPVFHLTGMTHRKNPVYLSTLVGRPPQEDAYLGKAVERIFLPMIRMIFPEIADMNFPVEAVFHNCVIVSIQKRYPGHAKKIIHGLWGMGQLMYTRTVIVVDDSIDVQNLSEVAWWVFNCYDPPRSFVISEGPLDALDHASNFPKFGSKVGIDCTRPWPEEGRTRLWPDAIAMDPSIAARVSEHWKHYGL